MKTNDFSMISSMIPDLRIISESEYRLIAFSKKHALLYHEWYPHSPEIDDEIFKSEALELFAMLRELRPTYFIPNDKKRKLSISEEINEFLVLNFQPIFAHPTMKKVALISNEQLSIQAQAESTMEEVKNLDMPAGAVFRFFIDVGQAVDWIAFNKK